MAIRYIPPSRFLTSQFPAIRQERRERFEQDLKIKEPQEYREYLAERRNLPEDRRNDVTGY